MELQRIRSLIEGAESRQFARVARNDSRSIITKQSKDSMALSTSPNAHALQVPNKLSGGGSSSVPGRPSLRHLASAGSYYSASTASDSEGEGEEEREWRRAVEGVESPLRSGQISRKAEKHVRAGQTHSPIGSRDEEGVALVGDEEDIPDIDDAGNYPYRTGPHEGDETQLNTLDLEALIASYRPILHPQASAAMLERRMSSMRSPRDSLMSSRSSSSTTAQSERGPRTPNMDGEARPSPELDSYRFGGTRSTSLRLSRSGSGQSVRFAASAISLHHDNASTSSVQTLPSKSNASEKSSGSISKLSRKLSAASVQSGYMSLFSSSARRKAAAQAKEENGATQHWMSGEIDSPQASSLFPDTGGAASLLERRPSALSPSSTRSNADYQQRSYSSPGYAYPVNLDRQRQSGDSADGFSAPRRAPLSAPPMAPSFSTPVYSATAARSSLQSQPDSPRSSFSSSGKSSFRWSVGSSGGASSSSGRTNISQSEYGPVLHIKMPESAVQRPISTILEHEQDPILSCDEADALEDPSLAVGISEPVEGSATSAWANQGHQRQESGALDVYTDRSGGQSSQPHLSVPSSSNRRHQRARESVDSFDFDMEGRSFLVKDFPTPPVVSRSNSVDATNSQQGYFDVPAHMQALGDPKSELNGRPRATSTSSAVSANVAPHPFSIMPAVYRRPSATSSPLALPSITAAPIVSPPAASASVVSGLVSDAKSIKSASRVRRAMSSDQTGSGGQLALPIFTDAPLRRTPSTASIASRHTARLQDVHFSS